jgi:hypothetical protein
MTLSELADAIEANLARYGDVDVGPGEWKRILAAMRAAGAAGAAT